MTGLETGLSGAIATLMCWLADKGFSAKRERRDRDRLAEDNKEARDKALDLSDSQTAAAVKNLASAFEDHRGEFKDHCDGDAKEFGGVHGELNNVKVELATLSTKLDGGITQINKFDEKLDRLIEAKAK
jgi:hypothetical protein